MTARLWLVPPAILLGSGLVSAQLRAPAGANVPFGDARPFLDAIRSDLLPPELQGRSAADIARTWDGWVAARDAQIRRRLERGDDDSLINLRCGLSVATKK